MKRDKITSSVNQYGSYTKPIDDFDKYQKRSIGSNRVLVSLMVLLPPANRKIQKMRSGAIYLLVHVG